MYTVVAGYLKYKEHRIWEKIGSRDDEEELKNMLVLAPDYDTELLNLSFLAQRVILQYWFVTILRIFLVGAKLLAPICCDHLVMMTSENTQNKVIKISVRNN